MSIKHGFLLDLVRVGGGTSVLVELYGGRAWLFRRAWGNECLEINEGLMSVRVGGKPVEGGPNAPNLLKEILSFKLL